MITCELDLTSTQFCDTAILTYEIELPPHVNKVGFNSLHDYYFTILYITDTILNSSACHKLTTQAQQNMWIIVINEEDATTAQGALDELNHHQNPHVKSKDEISICRSKNYERKYLGEIRSKFDQVRPVV